MLNPTHLRTVTVAVRTGSFAETARLLGYTTSAVSQQIAMLERAVGTQLFERSARSVRPTAVAEQMAMLSRDALAALSELEREVRALTRGDAGTLRLASFATANAPILASALAAIMKHRPDADILLDEGEPDEVLADVLDGDRDAAVVFAYDLDPRSWPRELVTVPLLTDPLVLVTSPGHRLASRADASLAEIADERWISTSNDTAGFKSLERLCATAGFRPRVTLRSNDYGTIASLVRRGLGVAIVPKLAMSNDIGLGVLRIAGADVSRRILALHRPGNTNPLLPMLLDALRSQGRVIAERWVDGDRQRSLCAPVESTAASLSRSAT